MFPNQFGNASVVVNVKIVALQDREVDLHASGIIIFHYVIDATNNGRRVSAVLFVIVLSEYAVHLI